MSVTETILTAVKSGILGSKYDPIAWLAVIVLAILIFIILTGILHCITGCEINIKLWKFEYKIKGGRHGKNK